MLEEKKLFCGNEFLKWLPKVLNSDTSISKRDLELLLYFVVGYSVRWDNWHEFKNKQKKNPQIVEPGNGVGAENTLENWIADIKIHQGLRTGKKMCMQINSMAYEEIIQLAKAYQLNFPIQINNPAYEVLELCDQCRNPLSPIQSVTCHQCGCGLFHPECAKNSTNCCK